MQATFSDRTNLSADADIRVDIGAHMNVYFAQPPFRTFNKASSCQKVLVISSGRIGTPEMLKPHKGLAY